MSKLIALISNFIYLLKSLYKMKKILDLANEVLWKGKNLTENSTSKLNF